MKQPIYKTYLEIPQLTKEYILTVAGAKKITEIPLSDINSFLQGFAEFDNKTLEEYEDGWVC